MITTETPFRIVEQPRQLAPGIEDVDLVAQFSALVIEKTTWEHRNREQKVEEEKHLRKVLQGVLEVADALERLILHTGKSSDNGGPVDKAIKSMAATQRLLSSKLATASVKRYQALGRPLDATCCAVEDWVTRDDLPEETVIEEIVPAYHWGEWVLRTGYVVATRHSNS